MQLNERRINHIKIVVIHGQTHKGSTYNITKLFLENFSDENTEIIEFFLCQEICHISALVVLTVLQKVKINVPPMLIWYSQLLRGGKSLLLITYVPQMKEV